MKYLKTIKQTQHNNGYDDSLAIAKTIT